MSWNLRQCDVSVPDRAAGCCNVESREEWLSDGCNACVERSKRVPARYRSEYRLVGSTEDRPTAWRAHRLTSSATRSLITE